MRTANSNKTREQQSLPDVLRDKILVELTQTPCEMPKDPVLLCEDEQLGPIHRVCQLHQPLGVKCGRGALEENAPFARNNVKSH